MATDCKTLVAVLRESQLIEPADWQKVHDMETRCADARGLGAHLVRAGLLTPFQVNQLLSGRGTELVLGPYHLLERIGEGGMGQVYRARHQRLQRIVALKVIRKEKLSDPHALERFQQEARAAAELSHPNIVTLYDASQDAGAHFLAMEFIEGSDLSQVVKRSGPLPVDRACDYVRQAALGLQHAHERGLVHRDVKPGNLLLTPDAASPSGGTIKILDMGLARLRGRDSGADPEAGLTQAGVLMGTPDFMAPEQAMNSRTVDARADLYSLGCTLYFLLTGQPLFAGETAIEKVMQHQIEEPPLLRTLRPDAPKQLEAVIRKLLAKRPEDRFPSAAAVVEALRPFGPGQRGPVVARVLAGCFRSRRRQLVAGLVACLLFGLGALAFSGSPDKGEPRQVGAASATPTQPQTVPSPPATETHAEAIHEGHDKMRDRLGKLMHSGRRPKNQ